MVEPVTQNFVHIKASMKRHHEQEESVLLNDLEMVGLNDKGGVAKEKSNDAGQIIIQKLGDLFMKASGIANQQIRKSRKSSLEEVERPFPWARAAKVVS